MNKTSKYHKGAYSTDFFFFEVPNSNGKITFVFRQGSHSIASQNMTENGVIDEETQTVFWLIFILAIVVFNGMFPY